MTAPLRILVVDDDRITCHATCERLRLGGYHVEAVESGHIALALLGAAPWDIVLTDLRMPGMDGLELLQQIKKRASGVDVLIMTAYGTIASAVAAMQAGAADYITKPFRFPELDLRVRRIVQLREAKLELERLRAALGEQGACCGIVGKSPSVLLVLDRVRLFADSGAPVLVTGATGTGKEMVAHAMHELGWRKGGPFVVVACGAVPPELQEAHLFGHDESESDSVVARSKGAFEAGVQVIESEIVGLVPQAALVGTSPGELKLAGFTKDQILEERLQRVLRG